MTKGDFPEIVSEDGGVDMAFEPDYTDTLFGAVNLGNKGHRHGDPEGLLVLCDQIKEAIKLARSERDFASDADRCRAMRQIHDEAKACADYIPGALLAQFEFWLDYHGLVYD